MNEEYHLEKIDKVYNKIKLYSRKKRIMGLDQNEIEKYNYLVANYLQEKLLLSDYVFQKYVFPLILYKQASIMYYEFSNRLKWKTELLVKQEQMDVVLNEYKKIEDKELLKTKLEDYYLILKENLNEYYDSLTDKRLFSEICLLLSNGMDDNFEVLKEHIDYIFEVLCIVLEYKDEGEDNEKISSKS